MASPVNTSIYQIFRACRLCGGGGGYKMPIVQNLVNFDCDGVELCQKIKECLQIEVTAEDKMPPLICELCVDKVTDFYEFLEMCRQTNRRTRLRLGLPAEVHQPVSEAGDCILGVTEPIYPISDDETPTIRPTIRPVIKVEKKEKPKGLQKELINLMGATIAPSSRKARTTKESTDSRASLPARSRAAPSREPSSSTSDDSFSSPSRLQTQSAESDSFSDPYPRVIKRSRDSNDLMTETSPPGIKIKIKLPKKKSKSERQKPSGPKSRQMSSPDQPTLVPGPKSRLPTHDDNCTPKSQHLSDDQSPGRKTRRLLPPDEATPEPKSRRISPPPEQKAEPNLSGPKSRLSGPKSRLSGPKSRLSGPKSGLSEPKSGLSEPKSGLSGPKSGLSGPKSGLSGSKTGLSESKPGPKSSKPPPGIQCQICETRLSSVQALTAHRRTHVVTYTDETHACNACGEWWMTPDEAVEHHKSHKLYRCSRCPAKFKAYQQYNGDNDAAFEHHKSHKLYRCSRCPAKFKAYQQYNGHWLTECSILGEVPDKKCASCWKLFPTKTLLAQHRCPGADGRPGGNCKKCGRTYASAKSLRRHETSCSIKKKASAAPASRQRHLPAVHVRIARCDQALGASGGGGRYYVAGLPKDFGLDPLAHYPYLKPVHIKSEPLAVGMVSVNQEVRNELYREEDYIHWDSENSDSDDECVLEANRKVRKVPTLTALTLKTIFSRRGLGKVPKKLRMVSNKDNLFAMDDDFSSEFNIGGLISNLDEDRNNVGLHDGETATGHNVTDQTTSDSFNASTATDSDDKVCEKDKGDNEASKEDANSTKNANTNIDNEMCRNNDGLSSSIMDDQAHTTKDAIEAELESLLQANGNSDVNGLEENSLVNGNDLEKVNDNSESSDILDGFEGVNRPKKYYSEDDKKLLDALDAEIGEVSGVNHGFVPPPVVDVISEEFNFDA